MTEAEIENTPWLQKILKVGSDGGLNESQIERIGYRAEIVRGLTREIELSTDPEFIKRAKYTLERATFDIYRIAAEGEQPPQSDAAGQT